MIESLSLRCTIGLLVTPAYICLTFVALSSTLVPFLKELALHGKTRSLEPTTTTSTTTRPQVKGYINRSRKGLEEKEKCWEQYWNYFLRGDNLLVSKRYFLHFYIGGLLSLVAFVMLSTATTTTATTTMRWDLVFLVAIHLLRRCYECVMIHQYPTTTSKMHLAGYICGLVHYLFLPFMLLGVTCGDDDHNSGMGIKNDSTNHSVSITIYLVGCTTLCFLGQYAQYYHHWLLATLRRPPKKESRSTTQEQVGGSRHKIPRGGWFAYVSCPHYLAEILIYISLAFMIQVNFGTDDDMNPQSCQNSMGTCFVPDCLNRYPNLLFGLLFLRQFRHFVLVVWVTSNLAVTAYRSHQWYLATFPAYHALNRKAILPGIF